MVNKKASRQEKLLADLYSHRFKSNINLTALAPLFSGLHHENGLPGIIGPFPLPLLIKAVCQYAVVTVILVERQRECQERFPYKTIPEALIQLLFRL